MPNGRVQAPEIPDGSNVRLQSAPLASDTFSGAPKPVRDDNLERISNALGVFNQSLLGLSPLMRKDNSAAAKNEFQVALATMTREDLLDNYKRGKLPISADPIARAGVDLEMGRKAAQMALEAYKSNLETGGTDKPLYSDDFNVDKDYQEKMRAFLSTHLQDIKKNGVMITPKFLEGWNDTADAGRKSMIEEQRQAKVKYWNDLAKGSAEGLVERILDDTGKQNLDATATMEMLRKGYKAGKDVFRRDFNEMDKITLNALDRLKDQYPERVMAILTAPRKKAEGDEALPSLYNGGSETGSIAKNIFDQARKKAAELEKQRALNVAVDDAYKAATNYKGDLLGLTDKEFPSQYDVNKKVLLTREEILAGVDRKFLEDQSASDVPKSVQFDRRYKYFTTNNRPDPELRGILNGVVGIANSTDATQPQNLDRLVQSAEMYNQYRTLNYPYLKQTIKLDNKAEDLFETYRTLSTLPNVSKEQAMVMAVTAVRSPNSDDARAAAQQKRDEIRSIARQNGEWFASTTMVGDMQERVFDLATALYRSNGLSAEDALKFAKKSIEERFVTINGDLVMGSGYLPNPEFKKVVEGYLDEFAKTNTRISDKTKYSAGKIGVRTIADGSYMLVDKDQGNMPIMVRDQDNNFVPATLTIKDILARKKAMDDADAAAIVEKQKRAAEDALIATPPQRLDPERRQMRQNIIDSRKEGEAIQSMKTGKSLLEYGYR